MGYKSKARIQGRMRRKTRMMARMATTSRTGRKTRMKRRGCDFVLITRSVLGALEVRDTLAKYTSSRFIVDEWDDSLTAIQFLDCAVQRLTPFAGRLAWRTY